MRVNPEVAKRQCVTEFVHQNGKEENGRNDEDANSSVNVEGADESLAEQNGQYEECRMNTTWKTENVEAQVVGSFSWFAQKHLVACKSNSGVGTA